MHNLGKLLGTLLLFFFYVVAGAQVSAIRNNIDSVLEAFKRRDARGIARFADKGLRIGQLPVNNPSALLGELFSQLPPFDSYRLLSIDAEGIHYRVYSEYQIHEEEAEQYDFLFDRRGLLLELNVSEAEQRPMPSEKKTGSTKTNRDRRFLPAAEEQLQQMGKASGSFLVAQNTLANSLIATHTKNVYDTQCF